MGSCTSNDNSPPMEGKSLTVRPVIANRTPISQTRSIRNQGRVNVANATGKPQTHVRYASGVELPATVFITNAAHPIGLATIRALNRKYPHIRIRGGLLKSDDPHYTKFQGLEFEQVVVDTSKRNVWNYVGIQAVLIIPSADDRTQTSLRYIASAKTAGVKMIAVVCTPSVEYTKKTGSNAKSVEKYLLQTKLACCFIHLPFDPTSDSPMGVSVTQLDSATDDNSAPQSNQSSSSYISVDDVGAACATICADPDNHRFAQYELQPEVAPSGTKKSSGLFGHVSPAIQSTRRNSAASDISQADAAHLAQEANVGQGNLVLNNTVAAY